MRKKENKANNAIEVANQGINYIYIYVYIYIYIFVQILVNNYLDKRLVVPYEILEPSAYPIIENQREQLRTLPINPKKGNYIYIFYIVQDSKTNGGQ